MKTSFVMALAGVTLLGCGSTVSFQGSGAGTTTAGSGGSKSSSSAGSGGQGGMATGSSSSGSMGGQGGMATAASTGATSSANASTGTSAASTSTSSASSSGVPVCGNMVCPPNEVCCASSNPPHCYNPSCLACCMSGASSSAASSASSSTGGSACSPPCKIGFTCCNGACVNDQNDIKNCGGCGVTCGGAHPYCDNGHCGTPPCNGIACPTFDFCCGNQCCAQGMLCCSVPEPVFMGPQCVDPAMSGGTCPVGCPLCP